MVTVLAEASSAHYPFRDHDAFLQYSLAETVNVNLKNMPLLGNGGCRPRKAPSFSRMTRWAAHSFVLQSSPPAKSRWMAQEKVWVDAHSAVQTLLTRRCVMAQNHKTGRSGNVTHPSDKFWENGILNVGKSTDAQLALVKMDKRNARVLSLQHFAV